MPMINLIHEQRVAVRREENRVKSMFLTIAVVAGASIGCYLLLTLRTDKIKAQAADLEKQIQEVKPFLKQLDTNQSAYNALSPRLKTLEDAQIVSARWNRILTHVSRQTPQGAWLTSLRSVATDPSKPIEVDFTGNSGAQEPVAEYIMRLQNSPDMQDVALKYTQEKAVANGQTIEFQISGTIVGTAEQRVQEEGK